MKESHFIDMMRAIQPHVSGRPKRSVELLIQSADLILSVHQYREPELSACDTSQDSIDFEAMLVDLQSVCNPTEAELINLILNFFRSRKIYSAYRTASQQAQRVQAPPMEPSAPKSSTANSDAVSGNDISASSTASSINNPAEKRTNAANTFRNFMENPAMQSFLSPAQKENLNQISTFMKAMS